MGAPPQENAPQEVPPREINVSPLSSEAVGEENRDLGFGSVLSRQRRRLLNRDGTFNVRRQRISPLRRFTSYHGLLTMSWPIFMVWVLVLYLVVNAVFAVCYMLAGPQSLQGDFAGQPYARAFYFSVETFSTIGYGNIVPHSQLGHLVMMMESMVGLLSFALVTGVVFARFAHPTAHIIYSRYAAIAPYRGITAFEFRIVNGRDNQIIDLAASVVLTRFERDGDSIIRRYYPLPLERPSVAFFPLTWTVVHPINQQSPLWKWDDRRLRDSGAEFLILLRGTDESFAQIVQSRSSYTAEEVKSGMRFASVFHEEDDGILTLDMRRFHALEPAQPEPAQNSKP
jgi:inward rectifier potassium channel